MTRPGSSYLPALYLGLLWPACSATIQDDGVRSRRLRSGIRRPLCRGRDIAKTMTDRPQLAVVSGILVRAAVTQGRVIDDLCSAEKIEEAEDRVFMLTAAAPKLAN